VPGARAGSRQRTADRELYGGLIRLHILHHAAEGVIFGLGIIEELATHGYRLSPGTLYPILHAMEQKGYLKARAGRAGRRSRKVYAITPRGARAFREAREKVKELFGELFAGR
jgi:DNA-binding PadR family transcriptional regulator